MAKRSGKIDTTADSGGDRRRPDPERMIARERAVSGEPSTGDRTAGREEGVKESVRGRAPARRRPETDDPND